MSAPTLPPAPARLSTMNCWPNAFDSSGATARARMSVVPPAANGTTILTGFVGQLPCAAAGRTARQARPAASASAARRSVCINAGSLDDRAELGDLGGDELAVLGRLH